MKTQVKIGVVIIVSAVVIMLVWSISPKEEQQFIIVQRSKSPQTPPDSTHGKTDGPNHPGTRVVESKEIEKIVVVVPAKTPPPTKQVEEKPKGQKHLTKPVQLLPLLPQFTGPVKPFNLSMVDGQVHTELSVPLPQAAYDRSAKSWKINPVLDDKCGFNVDDREKRPRWAQTVGVATPPTDKEREGPPRYHPTSYPPKPHKDAYLKPATGPGLVGLGGLSNARCIDLLLSMHTKLKQQLKVEFSKQHGDASSEAKFAAFITDDETEPSKVDTKPLGGETLFGYQPHVPYTQQRSPVLKMSEAEARRVFTEIFSLPHLVYVANIFRSLLLGQMYPDHKTVVPVWTTPLFMDHEEFVAMASGLDVPVRQFVFVWNGNMVEMRKALQLVRMYPVLPLGVTIVENPHINVGFSASTNLGILRGIELFKTYYPDEDPPHWTFCVNADVSFSPTQLGRVSYYANRHWKEYGLIYSEYQEHYAFGITLAAVKKVGLLDEVFYPAYMEDIDYRWRIRMCGLGQILTGARFRHVRNANLKKVGKKADQYRQQRSRALSGFVYGRYKWGHYIQADIYEHAAPSGWTTPFNVTGAPLSLWAVDPVHRMCVGAAYGIVRPGLPFCWYNGTVLRELLGPTAALPRTVVQPEPHQGYAEKWLDERVAHKYSGPQPKKGKK